MGNFGILSLEDFFDCPLVYGVVPFSKKIQRVTIQGAFGWYGTYLPKFGVKVVMVYKPSACFAFFYNDFVSTLPRLAT